MALCSFGQNQVRGEIVDASDKSPMVGVQVLTGNSTGTITNNRGEFSISVPDSASVIRITYLGYEDLKLPINGSEVNLGQIEMKVSATSLNEIIVSASSQNFSENFKGANFRLSPKTIENANPLNTEEVLRKIPGINIVGDMGLSNRPNISIRGSWGRRSKKVLLLEDGSPAAPAPYIAPGAYYNPVSDRIQSIEVYKGADMLRYGPNNMFGAVHYITALPPQKPELRVKMVGGERGYMTGLVSYGGTWGNLGSLIEGVYKKFDGFTDNSSVEVLNLNAKIFTKLSEDQSLYFKISGQYEDNQASLSSITPFTFERDPTQNPFDADIFTMRRYGLDIIHKWLITPEIHLTSKIYATDFARDWWRQVTDKAQVSDARAYLGDEIFFDRYSYLDGADASANDWVRVGRIANGRESTTDSRWAFAVSGLKETMTWDWSEDHQLEVGLKLHHEKYSDRFLTADSSRWARSGDPATDLSYRLWSLSGYVRNEFNFGPWSVTPIVRTEYVKMYRQDLLALRSDPNIQSLEDGRLYNSYQVFLPGITTGYSFGSSEIYTSLYRGFIAPSKVFGFLIEQDGVISNPLAGQSVNMQPELSTNFELGWRGGLFLDRLDGQVTYFNNHVRNFYAGGRNEVFIELGKIRIQGLETGLAYGILNTNLQSLRANMNLSLMQSHVISGALEDRDLFSQVSHNGQTRSEFISKVNADPSSYEIYADDGGGEQQLSGPISATDFQNITKVVLHFGDNDISDATVPYTPKVNMSLGLDYDYRQFSTGVSWHYVSGQFTEFNNFRNESADGAIGKLPSYSTWDAYANVDFLLGKEVKATAFINGKNITNQIYRASRLNRATSGIFPGGFRQIIVGMNIRI